MHDIFISYSHKDLEWVSRLANILEARGYDVWWDRELLASQDYADVIEGALNSTKCVLTVWSANSVRSKWVRAESSRGFNQNKMVPILIEEANIPIPYDSLHTADLRNWSGEQNDKDFVGLIDALDWLLKREKSPPAITPMIRTTKKGSTWVYMAMIALVIAIGAFFEMSDSKPEASNNTPNSTAQNFLNTNTAPATPASSPKNLSAAQLNFLSECNNPNGEKSIIKAAARGQVAQVSQCIELGTDINIIEGQGWTALHAAAFNGHKDVARKLFATGNAKLETKDNNNSTPLYVAVMKALDAEAPQDQRKQAKDVIIYLKTNGASTSVIDKSGESLKSRVDGNPELQKILFE